MFSFEAVYQIFSGFGAFMKAMKSGTFNTHVKSKQMAKKTAAGALKILSLGR